MSEISHSFDLQPERGVDRQRVFVDHFDSDLSILPFPLITNNVPNDEDFGKLYRRCMY